MWRDAATITHTWVDSVLKPLDEAMDDETCHPTRAAATMSDAEDDDAETCADGEENSNNPDTSDTYSDRPDWEQSETTSTKTSASSTSASSTALSLIHI